MNRKETIRMIKDLENLYKEKKSYIHVTEVAKTEEEVNFLYTPELFFHASKSRIIMAHWLMREVRRVYERASFSPVDISNEVYEYLRKCFKTKAFNKVSLLKLFGLTNQTVMEYEEFSRIEDTYIDFYNATVDKSMQLSNIKHIFIPHMEECIDLRDELSDMLSKEKVEEVLLLRSKGKTLDAIGSARGITRERARQIEIKPKALIERWMDERSSELIGVLGGEILADNNKGIMYFGADRWSVIKYCASTKGKHKFSGWNYIKELDTIVFSMDFYDDVICALKECIEKHGTEEDAFHAIHEKYKFFTRENMREFYGTVGAHVYGGQFYESRINIGKGIVAAVSEKFTDGIRISDEKQLSEFADYLNDRFGLNVKPTRALTARIQDILVMSDRATYKSPDALSQTDKLDEAIRDCVSKIDGDRTTYQMFFGMMPQDILKECGIDTYSGLHGYVKKNEERLGVVALRYYICKGGTKSLKSRDFFEGFNKWLFEKKRPCTEKEIAAEFEGWTDMYPKYAMLYFPQIVQWGNGTYLNLDCVEVSDDSVKQAKEVLDNATKNRIKYTNSYMLYPRLRLEAPGFVKDPLIKTESHIYLLLKYKLADEGEYVFAKPHIIRKSVMGDKTDFTTEDLIRCIIGKQTFISKTDITEEAQRLYGSKNSSLCLATQHVLDDYFRIGSRDYCKKSVVKFNSNDIKAVEDFIARNIWNRKFLVPRQASGYDTLPKSQFEWNEWSLCSFVEMYSSNYRVMFKRNNIIQNNMIIVPVSSPYQTREDIAVSILKEDYEGPNDTDSMLRFLKTVGLYRTIPNESVLKGRREI